MSCLVFTGPTIQPLEACHILDANYLPPVAQGDLYRGAREHPLAIGIIDGYFQNLPSVWHKEILWAMAEGIHVFGSASMGALRAAELHRFGMVGVGQIFQAYTAGRLSDDDEVAVTHGPPETGYVALSEAMINIRHSLAAAEAEGVISARSRQALEDLAKGMFFPDRQYDAVLAAGRDFGLPDGELAELEGWLPRGRIDRKKFDAVEMLTTMEAFLSGEPEPMRVKYRLETTYRFEDNGPG